ncbi:CHAT domain-containing protein [Zobellia sp. 1_MG-2023]|uniref:CHAT domain-containing protein n=1 Tax=Zobellia sp. 1_MG-2023 TaxID=3062626 RepID=UPI0026E1E220|nr:CHAT domain-containing tetratricopeptide repeat protein [Zobellia sp. 1_MG-2023]MDO6821275.1 CHAT domain-containing protein [Zobellia sp. 1_MG-2023]
MKQKLTIYLLFLISFCYSQDQELIKIIDSGTSLETRQTKIDSLVHIRELQLADQKLADFYHDLGSKWYQNNWWEHGGILNMQKAIVFTEKALSLKKDISNLKEGSIEKSIFNLAYYNYLIGKIFIAEDYYQLLIDSGKDIRLVEKGNRYLGMLYFQMGDFYKALTYLNQAILFYEKTPGHEHTLIEIHLDIATIYSEMGIKEHSSKIKNHLQLADILLQKSEIEDFYLRDDINHTEGDRLLETGQYSEAIIYHKKVLKDSANLYSYDINLVLNSLAKSHIQLKDFSTAANYLFKAELYNPDNSRTYEIRGDLHHAQNDFKKALFYYQKAIVWTTKKNNKIDGRNQPTSEDLEISTTKLYLLNHLIAKANCWLNYYKYDNNTMHLDYSLTTFSLADKLVDIIRSESTENKSKLFWREKGASLYTKAVEVCYLLNKPQDAFYFMERNKALLLLEDITAEQAKDITRLPKETIQREYELKQSIFLAESKLKNSNTKSQDTLLNLKSIIYNHKNTYSTFKDSLSSVFPEYEKLSKQAFIIPYPEFKKKFISQDEVVLQYILNDEQGYALLTTVDDTLFFKLKNTENLNQDIIQLYGQLTNLTMDRAGLATYNQLSNHVFQQLVPEQVYEQVKNKKLTIISDHILQQIPFEAFVANTNPVRFFIEDTEVRYAYSMSYLEAKTRVSSSPSKEFYGIAPVQFASLGLPNLIFSGSEIEEVQKIFPGDIALKVEATKSAFVNNFEDYRIVHLSTHADVGQSEDPWIAFNDDKMFLNEIYATKNQAEMVVLSACNTSIGELKKGEGAMSLARGFFHSGARSVVSSLWSTYDKSSKELITSFYTELAKGATKSAAMRQAKLNYIQKYRESAIAPAYWSALIVIGDNSPITNQTGLLSSWIWALLGILLLIVAYQLFKRKK